MNKFDEILNELVYQIDDIVYSFYSRSNEIIAAKRSQERLFTFRDNTLNTLNDMNVRSLEIISGFKNKDLVDERAEKLLLKNQTIVDSAVEVLEAAPDRSDFLDDMSDFANSVISSAKDVVKKVEKSGVYDKVVDAASEGINKAKSGIEDLSRNPKVIEGAQVLKEKTKEAVDLGSKIVKEGSRKIADWVSDLESDIESETPEEE